MLRTIKMTVIGRVSSLLGRVISVDAVGNESVLAIGDEIFEGDVLMASAGAMVELRMNSTDQIVLSDGQVWTPSADTYSTAKEILFEDQIIGPDKLASINSIQQAFLSGEYSIEFAETTATGTDSSAGKANDVSASFVQVERIVTNIGEISEFKTLASIDRTIENSIDRPIETSIDRTIESSIDRTIENSIAFEVTDTLTSTPNNSIETLAPSAPIITRAIDENTLEGTMDIATSSVKIFVKDINGVVIAEYRAIVDNTNATWTANFDEPAVGHYNIVAVASNAIGDSAISDYVNVDVLSSNSSLADTDANINIVFNSDGTNEVSTGSGNDVIKVARGNDSYSAADGNDIFIVEGANKGRNYFDGGEGYDSLIGGDGDDEFTLATTFNLSQNSIEEIDGGSGINNITFDSYHSYTIDFSDVLLTNINAIIDESTGHSNFTGNHQDNIFRDGAGNDTYYGKKTMILLLLKEQIKVEIILMAEKGTIP
jgi:Ca2+-binding RTX toxin-like protein